MSALASYFVKKNGDTVSSKENILMGKNYRFSVLTERLIRLEYSVNGVFEDRASSNVVFRAFPRPVFVVNESDTLLQISTKYFVLSYVKNKAFGSSKLTPGTNLKILLKDTEKTWYYNHPEARNFGGLKYSLDDFTGKLVLDKGLYSTDGFCVLDDSNTLVIDNDMYVSREKGNIDIYVFMYKRDFGLCLKDYFDLTGYPTFIPRYTLGNWWFKNDVYTNKDISRIVKEFNNNEIPLSVIMLGSYWHDNVNPYSFDNKRIDCESLVNFLHEKKIRLGLTVDPTLKLGSDSLSNSSVSNYLEKGSSEFSFVPVNNQKLEIYINNFIRSLSNSKVDLFYIDYNNRNDLNTLYLFNHYHYVDMIVNQNKRGVILSRNSKISSHRYPIIFTGKTIVDWNTLNSLPEYTLSASNNGVSFVAHAIGGYYKGVEQEELYMRYIQYATFSPFLILSSEGGKYYKREPWKWNNLRLSVIREYMQLRNKLIPYIYTESYNYYSKCIPLVQPLYYKYSAIYDEPLYKNEYFFGSEMLVCPITKKKNLVINRVVQRIFMPEGLWFDFRTGKKYPGNKYYMCFYKDDEYPVFCKSGSIIPLSLNDDTSNPNDMEIVVFPLSDNNYLLYEDDGISNNYRNQEYLVTDIKYKYMKDNYVVSIKSYGKFNLMEKRNYKIRFKNTININEVSVTMGNNLCDALISYDRDDFIVYVENVNTSQELVISIKGNDIDIDVVQLINEDIREILNDLEIETILKEKIDAILFSDMSIRQKRIEIKKLRKWKLEPKFINMFIKLLEYISNV